MGLTKSQVFPSRYLSKEDVAHPARGIISDVRMETFTGDRGEEDKAILVFDDPAFKPMVLNSTNWDCIEAAYGLDTDGWVGKPVEVYVDTGVMLRGRRVGGIRVRIPAGTAVPAGNGTPRVDTWTWAEAQQRAAAAGFTKEQVVDALKSRGSTGYNPVRDTPIVRELIASVAATEPTDDMPSEDSIPFN